MYRMEIIKIDGTWSWIPNRIWLNNEMSNKSMI